MSKGGGAYLSLIYPILMHTFSYRFILLLRPFRGAENCDQPVCLSVCLSVREHISGTAVAIFTKFFVQIPCAMFSPPLAAL